MSDSSLNSQILENSLNLCTVLFNIRRSCGKVTYSVTEMIWQYLPLEVGAIP